MQIEVLSDQDKVIKWEAVCSSHGWITAREMSDMLSHMMVRFTSYGSAVPTGPFALFVESIESVKKLVKSSGPNKISKLVLQSLCGILQFNGIMTEYVFWTEAQRKLIEEHGVEIPDEIIPTYIINDSFNVEERLRQ